MLEQETEAKIEKSKIILSKKEKWTAILVLVLLVVLIAVLLVFRKNIDVVNIIGQYSLIGLLIVSVIACSPASAVVPIPYLLVTLTLPSILAGKWGIWAPGWVGLTAAFGATIGQSLTFMIGYGNRSTSASLFTRISEKAYNKALVWIKKYGSTAIFIVSVIPNPIHLPVTIALGASRFSPRRWFLLSLAGNLVKCLFIAFAGYYGVAFVLHLIGS